MFTPKSVKLSRVNAHFAYKPLDRVKQQIRLFRFDLTKLGYGMLEHFDLNAAPPYQALSYTWGKADHFHTLYVDDQPFHVRCNLYNFLRRYFRDKLDNPNDEDLEYIWIDQICIDQRSLDEKGHQVAMMGKIYKSAQRVLTWLGTDFGKSPEFKMLANLLERHLPDSEIHKMSSTVAKIVSQPYWSRVWVAQELILARKCIIMFDDARFDLSSIKNIFDRDYIPATLDHILRRLPLNERPELARTDWLKQLLLTHAHCGNLRDHIYGIQGLLALDLRVPVDYSMTTEDVFLAATAKFIAVELHKDIPNLVTVIQILANKMLLSKFAKKRWTPSRVQALQDLVLAGLESEEQLRMQIKQIFRSRKVLGNLLLNLQDLHKAKRAN